MGRKKVSVINLVSLAGLALMLLASLMRTGGRAWTGAANGTPKLLESAPASEPITIRATGRGSPWMNLQDGRELPTVYRGAIRLEQMMAHKLAVPTALASADFDEDGVPDLISGYVGPSGGLLTLHRGNLYSIYPNAPRTSDFRPDSPIQCQAKPVWRTQSAFEAKARVFEVEVAPDFLGAGDFDADGHWDVVAAARGSNQLSWLAGDGRGGFGAAKQIRLPGSITALIVGEINRRDGLDDVVVSIAGADGAQALVFEGPEGALSVGASVSGRPLVAAGDLNAGGHSGPPRQVSVPLLETIALPAEATALALGQLDESYEMDLAVAAGSELVIVHGRDRKLSLDEIRQAGVSPASIDQQRFPFEISSLAVGDFVRDKEHRLEIAVLSESGTAYLLDRRSTKSPIMFKSQSPNRARFNSPGHRPGNAISNSEQAPRGRNKARSTPFSFALSGLIELEASVPGAVPQAIEWRSFGAVASRWRLISAKVSNLPTDDLVVLDRANHQVHILTTDDRQQTTDTEQSAIINPRSSILSADGAPVAVLPMRLNSDALNDLVILNEGSSTPTVLMTAAAATFTVTNTNDSGAGSLRQAILDANANPGADLITFSIGSGVKTITPTSALPEITDPVTIDGTTQPGFSGSPIIELNGTDVGTGKVGITITAGSSTVRGLVINRYLIGSIMMETNGKNIIEANFIGTDVAGTAALGSSLQSVWIESANNMIGGTTASARNVISAKDSEGVIIVSAGATGNKVQGNYIGTDATGTVPLGSFVGIQVQTTSDNIIGGTTASARNIISGNSAMGVLIGESAMTLVQGNFIGTDVTGTKAVGNSGVGVWVASSNTTVGGTTPGAGNKIAYNGGDGVLVGGPDAPTGNAILSNSIFSNGGLGINLCASGFDDDFKCLDAADVTPNDLNDTDTGPNNLQNYPVLSSAIASSSGSVTIQGTLASVPGDAFTIQFFSNSSCDPSGYGEGQKFIGSTVLATNAAGIVTFTVTLPGPVVMCSGATVTATATDSAGNTSEFSPCKLVTGQYCPEIDVFLIPFDLGIIPKDTFVNKLLTVRNKGTAPLMVTPIAPPDPMSPFQLVSPTEPFTLQRGQRRSLTVRFRPRMAG